MNIQETNGLLAIISEYWPNFEATESKARAWQDAISNYTRNETWDAVKELRAQPDRAFAPTISELIGSIEAIRELKRHDKARTALLLSQPEEVRESLESYSYKTTYKDDLNAVMNAVRCTKARRDEIHREMTAQGYVKEIIPLSGGKVGYRYV